MCVDCALLLLGFAGAFRRSELVTLNVEDLTFTPDGQALVSRGIVFEGARSGEPGESETRHVRVWDLATGKQRRALAVGSHPHGMALAPDGRTAISGSGYYEYKDGRIVVKDGQVVYTDCLLRLWDLDSGKELQALKSSTVRLVNPLRYAIALLVIWAPWSSSSVRFVMPFNCASLESVTCAPGSESTRRRVKPLS